MTREFFLVGILGFGMASGLFSPLKLAIVPFVKLFSPAFFLPLSGILFVSSLIVSTATIMLAGLLAAIYERVFGLNETDTMSLWIWVSATALLSLPAVLNVFRIGLP